MSEIKLDKRNIGKREVYKNLTEEEKGEYGKKFESELKDLSKKTFENKHIQHRLLHYEDEKLREQISKIECTYKLRDRLKCLKKNIQDFQKNEKISIQLDVNCNEQKQIEYIEMIDSSVKRLKTQINKLIKEYNKIAYISETEFNQRAAELGKNKLTVLNTEQRKMVVQREMDILDNEFKVCKCALE